VIEFVISFIPIFLVVIVIALTIVYNFIPKRLLQSVGLWILILASVYWLCLDFYQVRKYLIKLYISFGIIKFIYIACIFLFLILFSLVWVKREKFLWFFIFLSFCLLLAFSILL